MTNVVQVFRLEIFTHSAFNLITVSASRRPTQVWLKLFEFEFFGNCGDNLPDARRGLWSIIKSRAHPTGFPTQGSSRTSLVTLSWCPLVVVDNFLP